MPEQGVHKVLTTSTQLKRDERNISQRLCLCRGLHWRVGIMAAPRSAPRSVGVGVWYGTVAAFAMLTTASASNCTLELPRKDCGYVGIAEPQCLNIGCCWSPIQDNPDNKPWCAKRVATPPPTPPPPSAWQPGGDGTQALAAVTLVISIGSILACGFFAFVTTTNNLLKKTAGRFTLWLMIADLLYALSWVVYSMGRLNTNMHRYVCRIRGSIGLVNVG